ncbi:MAG TPA: hypothetical protein ENN29_06710 [Candidatus Hydrogenedentes bacterium]|nr:hypothetical protein [Candidatus Hydrogenedentota bacterium]
MYIRFQSLEESPYTGEKYGIFVAVWHLIRDKKVTHEEEAEYWKHRAWFENNLPIPPFYEAGNQEKAITWFKTDALTVEMKKHLLFYFELAKKYDMTIVENTTDSLANVIYEDIFQVAMIPKKC